MNVAVRVAYLSPGRLALSLSLALSAVPAHAFTFASESGEVKGSFDTTLSVGASWRMQDRDPALVAITNGGTSRDPNSDDGNLNYNKGGVVYSAIKGTHDFDLSYRNYGMFLRGTYFFDPVNDTKNFLGPEARDRMVSEADLLDAYVRGSFDVGGRNLNLRLGSQVLNWGESTFILNGINVVNPVDVTKLRTPGSELKEAFVPSNMVWASQELNNNVTVEAFAITNWKKTRIDPRGSFFSTTDLASDDADKGYIGFGRRKDQHFPTTNPSAALAAFFPGVPVEPNEAQIWIPRAPDRNPSDSGQYGLAMRVFAPALNNTEFGIYHVNYHSRTPYVSGIAGTVTSLLTSNATTAAASGHTGTARYFVEYPEDIRLYGASFNTSIPGGVALQGEYSYRPNQPLQLPTAEILLAGLGATNQLGTFAAGQEVPGYQRVVMRQIQFTATKAFGPTIGADEFVLLGEAGYTRLGLGELKFGGPGVHLPQPGSSTSTSFGSTSTDGFATTSSWGYRLLTRLDFNNAIGAATISPRIAFAHDVDGVSPTFVEGVKAATLGLDFSYRQVWQADIAYTAFWGGKTYSGTDPAGPPSGTTQSADYASSSNLLKDRDFLAVSVSYSF
jgi:hypothetical protein